MGTISDIPTAAKQLESVTLTKPKQDFSVQPDPNPPTVDEGAELGLSDVTPREAALAGEPHPEILTTANVVRKFGNAVGVNPQDVQPGICIGIAAPGGVGKTTLAGTVISSPYASPALLLSKNANAHVIPDTDKLFVVPMRDCNHLEMIITEFEKGENADIKTFILDHITAMYDTKFEEIKVGPKTNNDPRSWYNLTNAWLMTQTRRLINLAEGSRRLNVVFIFQEVQEDRVVTEPNSGGMKQQLRKEVSLSNKMQGYWPSLVPFLGFLYTASDTEDPAPRVLDFRALSWSTGKKQVKNTERLKLIPGMVWEPDLGHLIEVLQNPQCEWNTAKHTRVIKKQDFSVPQDDSEG